MITIRLESIEAENLELVSGEVYNICHAFDGEGDGTFILELFSTLGKMWLPLKDYLQFKAVEEDYESGSFQYNQKTHEISLPDAFKYLGENKIEIIMHNNN
jgi:hypothetical protein